MFHFGINGQKPRRTTRHGDGQGIGVQRIPHLTMINDLTDPPEELVMKDRKTILELAVDLEQQSADRDRVSFVPSGTDGMPSTPMMINIIMDIELI